MKVAASTSGFAWRMVVVATAVVTALVPMDADAQQPPAPSVPVPAQASARTDRDSVTGVEGARPITLAEAFALARANSPQSVQARGTTRANRAAVRAAQGAFLPNVNVSVGAVRQFRGESTQLIPGAGGSTVVTTRSGGWTYSNGFALNTQLFDPSRFGELRAARADVTASQGAEVAQRYTVSLDVAQQYYNALSARESESAARAQLAQAEQQLSASVRRYRAGAATRSDSLRSFVQVANARVAVLTAAANLRAANAALTRLVGAVDVVTPVASDTAVAPGMGALPFDSAGVVALALRGPVVAQAEASLTAARELRGAARTAYLPTVGMTYSRSGSGADSRFGFGDNAFNYGGQLSLSLSYPLFNQFNREAQNVRADVVQNNAEATLRDARLAARQNAVQLWDEFRTAAERVAAQRAAVVAAEEDLRVQQARYDIGASTLVDVLTSQTQLNEARSALIAARYDVRIARARIESLIGRDLPTSSTSATPTPNTTTPTTR